MIIRLIFTIIIGIIFIYLLYASIIAIRENDNTYAVTCSLGAGLMGMVFGILLSFLIL